MSIDRQQRQPDAVLTAVVLLHTLEMAGSVQRHHVGRGLLVASPMGRQWDAALELDDAFVGSLQPAMGSSARMATDTCAVSMPWIIDATLLASMSVPCASTPHTVQAVPPRFRRDARAAPR